MSRSPVSELDGGSFDVIVIGAGINGATSAQHLSAAGYSVLLVDKDDFGSGSTGRSTRMLHCGLRYFETPNPILDFALSPKKLLIALRMAKASMEVRGELVKDSPERLRPFTLLFPIFRDGPYKGWMMDLAFKILGRFGPRDVPLDYRRLPADQCDALPFVAEMGDRDRLDSVACFTEYMFDWPDRVCLDAVLDAERMGAVVRNHTTARLGERDARGKWTVTLTDPTGTAQVRAPIVLNMAGIWIDRVNADQEAKPKRLILGTKGAHLVVRLPERFRDHGVATINSLGEPHYILPSQGGRHHIGPTETVYEGNLDDIHVGPEDRDFLLRETTTVLPGLKVAENDVEYSWAGVRPLGHDPDFPKGKRSVEIHDLAEQGLPSVHAMTAGPIMTHRSAGRDMVETVRAAQPPSGDPRQLNYAPRAFPENPNSPALSARLPDLKLSDFTHAAEHEHAATLTDALAGRTGLIYRLAPSEAEMRRAAEAMAVSLGWDSAEVERQVDMAATRLRHLYQMNIEE